MGIWAYLRNEYARQSRVYLVGIHVERQGEESLGQNNKHRGGLLKVVSRYYQQFSVFHVGRIFLHPHPEEYLPVLD